MAQLSHSMTPRPSHPSLVRGLRFAGSWRRNVLLAGMVLVPLFHAGCQSVAGTDRRQLNAYSVDQEIALGDEAYAEMQVGAKAINAGRDFEMVVRVADRIAAAADRLHPEIASRFEWEVILIEDDDVVNAWALPQWSQPQMSSPILTAFMTWSTPCSV